MIKNKQLFRHDPPYSIGDCHRTAIACLLDLQPEEVPHFGADLWDKPGELFNQAFDDWLAGRGLRTYFTAWGGGPAWEGKLQDVLDAVGCVNPGIYYLLGGTSANGTDHTVVCCGREMCWDPAIDGSGIVGPASDGYYWVAVLVPSSMYAEVPK